jgi:uncharacterized protein (TIGR03083 family)
MALSIELAEGQDAFEKSVLAFLGAVDRLTDHQLFAHSRCHGWLRLDVLAHVLGGWQEMLIGFVRQVDATPTVDAASYWTAFAQEMAEENPIAVLMTQRRRSDAHPSPAGLRAQLRDVSEAVLHGARTMTDYPRMWQGHVFTAGDYLAIWAVEDAVHHLDLDVPDDTPPATALSLCRRTIEALVGEPLPGTWTDLDAVLAGTGRIAVPAGGDRVADRLPALC